MLQEKKLMVLKVKNFKVNSDRLWESLMEMAKIGETEKGGVCRLALTDVDKKARDLFVQWCESSGCKVTVDEMGNIFGRREGKNRARRWLNRGSSQVSSIGGWRRTRHCSA